MKYSEDKVIRMVKATQEIEGIRVSENAEKMARELIREEKTKDQLLEEIRQSHKQKAANMPEASNRYTGDVYTYPDTGVLINCFEEKKQVELDILEGEVTTLTIADLIGKPVKGSYDFKHLKEIHRRIFREIYPFSGEVRRVNISKGGSGFCQVMFIENMADEIFRRLKKDDLLKGLDEDTFKKKLLYYMGELNALHPFREGNGRSQREFLRVLSLNAGWSLNCDLFDGSEILEADIDLFNCKEEKMRNLFERGLVTNATQKI